jgi:Mg2+/Co2+ transporter CorB
MIKIDGEEYEVSYRIVKKMGRPPLYKETMKQISGIYLTPEQIAWINKQEVKRGEYIRRLIDKEIKNDG